MNYEGKGFLVRCSRCARAKTVIFKNLIGNYSWAKKKKKKSCKDSLNLKTFGILWIFWDLACFFLKMRGFPWGAREELSALRPRGGAAGAGACAGGTGLGYGVLR